jgi:hypothetical protein
MAAEDGPGVKDHNHRCPLDIPVTRNLQERQIHAPTEFTQKGVLPIA